MRFKNLSALILSTLVFSGCGGGSSEDENNGANNTDSNNLHSSSNDNTISARSQSLASNIVFAIEGLMEKKTGISNYTAITVIPRLPAFQARNIQKIDITIPTSTIIKHNNSNFIKDWHCYQTTDLSVQRKNQQLSVNGSLTEYQYDSRINECSGEPLKTYVFNNAVFNSSLILNAAASVIVKDKAGVETQLPTYQFIATAYAEQSKKHFGDAWEKMQRDKISAAAAEIGESMFVLNRLSGNIDLDVSKLNNQIIIDFTSLDKSLILNGSIWGMPGQGKANENWCRIVNIPTDINSNSIKYQSIIATNCARSTRRYCDTYGSSFLGGIFPAVAPVAWDSSTANNAQLNSDEQFRREKQGHFIANSFAQNAFILSSNTAITPIFGYTAPRNDGKNNNAGKNSWAGHEGHCQNVMNQRYTRMGTGYRKSKGAASKISYWTQDFN